MSIALDAEGGLCCEMWPGNTTDVKTFLPVVERMRRRFRVLEMYVVADRGMVCEETLAAFGAMQPVHDILGVRMRRQKEVGEIVLKSRKPWVEITPERRCAKDPPRSKTRKCRWETIVTCSSGSGPR